jgi:uncharacterized protein (TIGR01777 family)
VIDWSTINPSFLSDTNILIKLNGEKVDQFWTKSVKSKILNSRIDSTKMLFDFCVKNEIIPQKFINASAVGIYAKESANYNFSVDENSELGNTFLAKVCVENERNSDIFKVFEDIDIIQLRIGVVLQKKIINLLSLNLLLSLPVPGNKNHYFPWVHANDIVGFVNHSIDNNLTGAFNLVGSELTTHDTFFKSILKHKKSIISWVIFLPKFLIKFIFGNMSEMFLYGPKTKPARTLESNYQFKYSSLQEALLNLTE